MLSLSRIFINLAQDISDSPLSNLEICDFDKCSSATELMLICFPLRIFLRVFPKLNLIYSHFHNKNNNFFSLLYNIEKKKGEIRC